ncbi:MAG TPA: alpha/beta fold hydrolase [Kofleriaceae bacterium]|nr:alpha/beta fold hydrolase [Kofleriaceae bacterium]
MRELWFGDKLFAIEEGTGTPLVALHGGLADHRLTRGMLGALAGPLRLITPDLRGSGRSHDPGPLTWDRLADDIPALLDHLALPRAIVLGMSSASGVAVRFALRHPDRLAALVAMLPVYPGRDRGLTDAQRATFAMMDALGRRAPAEGPRVLLPLLERLPPERRERAAASLHELDPASIAATTAWPASGEQPFETAGELRAITAPALIVPGSDATHPADVAALYAAELPHATVVRDPDVTAAIAAWCATIDP